MTSLSTSQQGSIYAILSGLCYGLMGYFGVNIMNANLSISNMLFWRFLTSTFFIFILSQFISRKNSSTPSSALGENLKILFCGIGFYGPSTVIYFMASKYIGTGLAMIIFFTYPVFVILLNVILFRVSVNKIYYFSAAIIVIGIFMLIDREARTLDFFGVGLAVLSAIFYSLYIVASTRVDITPVQSTLMVSVGCMITSVIVSFSNSSLSIPVEAEVWFNIICIAVVCTAIPILLLLQALKYISSEKASILSVLEPVFVLILGVMLLNEKVNNLQIFGVIITLGGATVTLSNKQAK